MDKRTAVEQHLNRKQYTTAGAQPNPCTLNPDAVFNAWLGEASTAKTVECSREIYARHCALYENQNSDAAKSLASRMRGAQILIEAEINFIRLQAEALDALSKELGVPADEIAVAISPQAFGKAREVFGVRYKKSTTNPNIYDVDNRDEALQEIVSIFREEALKAQQSV